MQQSQLTGSNQAKSNSLEESLDAGGVGGTFQHSLMESCISRSAGSEGT